MNYSQLISHSHFFTKSAFLEDTAIIDSITLKVHFPLDYHIMFICTSASVLFCLVCRHVSKKFNSYAHVHVHAFHISCAYVLCT